MGEKKKPTFDTLNQAYQKQYMGPMLFTKSFNSLESGIILK